MDAPSADMDISESSACSPATTAITLANSPACFSPFTDASAPSTISSAPSSPQTFGKRQHRHHNASLDSITAGSLSRTRVSAKDHDDGDDDEDAWQHVTDPRERRKIQNRIAQRKYRVKAALQRETDRRDARNQQLAGGSYARPWVTGYHEPLPEQPRLHKDGDAGPYEFSGVPWGGLDFAAASRPRGQQRQEEQQQQQATATSDEQDLMRHYAERQKLLWQRQQMRMRRQHRQREEYQTRHQQQQQHSPRHDQEQVQQASSDIYHHSEIIPNDSNYHLMPPPSIIPAATPRPGVSDVQEKTAPYPAALSPTTTIATATDLYDAAMHPYYIPPQQHPSSMMDTFFGAPRAMIFDDELPSSSSSYTTQQTIPIDPALLVGVGSGDGITMAGSNFLPGGTMLMAEDAEGELLEWPD